MSKVTRLNCTPHKPEEISLPGNARLLRHWLELRGGRAMPDKRQLDLKLIRHELPWLGLVERAANGRFVWRLAGSGLCGLWNRELTGDAAFGDWPRFERDTLGRLLSRAMDDHRPAVARLNLKSRQPQASIPAEMLTLPLLDVESGETIVLVSILPRSGARNPALYDIHDVELTFMRVIWPDAPAVNTAPAAMLAGRERRRGAFRVITGGRD